MQLVCCCVASGPSHHDPSVARHLHTLIRDQRLQDRTAFQDMEVPLDQLGVEVNAPHLIITTHYRGTVRRSTIHYNRPIKSDLNKHSKITFQMTVDHPQMCAFSYYDYYFFMP